MNPTLVTLYRQAEDYFFTGISSKCMTLDEGATAYRTGVPEATLNFVYLTQNPHALDKILYQCKAFFDQEGLSFIVMIPQEFCTPQTNRTLSTMSYLQIDTSFSMAVNLDKWLVQSASSFDNEVVLRANDDRLDDWIVPLISAFDCPYKKSALYAATHERALKQNINLLHFSVYKQERPITSVTLSLNGSCARIDDMGTHSEFQGKGYATLLLKYVLSEAKRLGARQCFLEASDSGLELYQKLGFETLFNNNIYSRQS